MKDAAEPNDAPDHLADFTATPRVLLVALIAVALGGLASGVARALIELIAVFTNLFFFQRLSDQAALPAGHHLGPLVILVPVAGALLVGVIARYGSERIRGHGIPEALEAILLRGSRVEPRVALLKPLSAAISIGSGGPFGAEGPIIMTGGAFGSIVGQLLHLTAAERKTLLVAGAAAGMSATFGSPIAAVLLAVELLLFEWKPRSFIPVALASATAAILRPILIGAAPLFPVLPHAEATAGVVVGALVCGLSAGLLSGVLTRAVYASEDAFKRLPIHWMWWPAIGGLAVGIGGFFYPRALGVGYETLGAMLAGSLTTGFTGLMVAKGLIWAIALGSGTSGGVLAPLLMMGGALGGLESGFLPAVTPGFWPLIGMGAILGGTMRSPFTGVLFMVEITHDLGAALPLLVAVTTAHAFTVLVLRRSILTEKLERRGFHVSREYAVDPLEILFVREVAHPGVLPPPASDPINAVRPDDTLRHAAHAMATAGVTRLAVVEPDAPDVLLGVVELEDLLKARSRHLEEEGRRERLLGIALDPPRLVDIE